MSSSTFTIRSCDRCGHAVEVRQPGDDAGWSIVSASDLPRAERARTIGSYQQPADLCPGCAIEMFVWWERREPVDQPSAPAPAPPPRRFTIEDKARAIDRAAEALRAQVAQAMDAAREQPTSLLGGQILVGGIAGIEQRAAGLVDYFVLLLGDGAAAEDAR